MTSKEKAELLKPTIHHLYVNEGHSIGYISRLLEINRTTISHKIKEWKFPENRSKLHLRPSDLKRCLKYKMQIVEMVKQGKSEQEIADAIEFPVDILHKALRHKKFSNCID